jgi:transposase-like protein
MLRMDQVHVIRHKVLREGASIRRVARELGLSRNTVSNYLAESGAGATPLSAASTAGVGTRAARLEELLVAWEPAHDGQTTVVYGCIGRCWKRAIR